MATRHGLYRACIALYPRSFRQRYGEDLVEHFGDLAAHRGVGAAWARTALDLIVTIPSYRLESIMTERRSTTTLYVTITLLAAASVVAVLTGVYSGMVFLLAAAAVAVAQRSALARAIRVPDSHLRRRRFTTSAILALVFVASLTAYYQLIGDTWTIRETLLAGLGTTAMLAAITFFVVGLLTPRKAVGLG